MRNISVTTLKSINLVDLTKIWNRCWRGYYCDMSYKPEYMKLWLDLSQVSLQHSIAIIFKEQVIGFALLSIEGADGWIAGTCIDPDYRRKGIFAPLLHTQLDLANRIGLKRIYLEVLEQNHARIVYQSVGFIQVRQLGVYRSQTRFLSNRIEARPLRSISLKQYFEIRRRAFFNPSWQRREGYLRRYRQSLAFVNSAGTAGALFAGEKNAPLIDVWSGTAAGAEEVVNKLLLHTGEAWSLTNQPEDWIAALLRSNGINPSVKQFEMCCELT
ncbi:GNAT family N-acetyltransferase [Desulfosporosinus sp. Sb-LF]|uniref:GNAT family N-acetyltransferase n=1 Tax=Desulfosporosinus sp. Sb-LF TaxID=2560027 RepID=UPI00107F9929|nr:GNAT family N-acetyltransferase [Desulfosporosinus sp. Sb-LF]TGE32438.1 GNAT family N-acetyltransferase [Desulfosporosinus sp. Sb-LF]